MANRPYVHVLHVSHREKKKSLAVGCRIEHGEY